MKQNGNGIHDFRILISYVKYYVAKNKKYIFMCIIIRNGKPRNIRFAKWKMWMIYVVV